MELSDRWQALGAGLRLPNAVGIFQAIESAYARPPGWYHTLSHVEDCLSELDPVRHLADDADAVELALWFHDAIYDPKAKDNEELSADLLQRTTQHPLVEEAARLILATKHLLQPEDPNAKLIVDIDLSILGKPDGRFDLYEEQIRTEYAWVPEDDYRRGRTAVLSSFLERSLIYSTTHFSERYEAQARRNLLRSITNLG